MRCIMKQYLFFALATFLFVACGSNSQKSIEYVKQTSNDKTYSIDVPKSASRNLFDLFIWRRYYSFK